MKTTSIGLSIKCDGVGPRLIDTRQVATGVDYHDTRGTAGLFVNSGITSNRGFATFLQYLIFTGAGSTASTDDVCPEARGTGGKNEFHQEGRERQCHSSTTIP